MKNRVEVDGFLEADVTIRLDERPDLPAGPVQVTLQVAAGPPPEGLGWREFLQWIKAEQIAGRYVPRTAEEIDAQLSETRREDEKGDQRIDQNEGTQLPTDVD